jgi:hypothetical protein
LPRIWQDYTKTGNQRIVSKGGGSEFSFWNIFSILWEVLIPHRDKDVIIRESYKKFSEMKKFKLKMTFYWTEK